MNTKQQKTVSIMRQIVEAVCNRRERKLHAAMNSSNRQKIGHEIYGVQHIRERWLWTSWLERYLTFQYEQLEVHDAIQ